MIKDRDCCVSFPIIIGVTGHRDIPKECEQELIEQMKQVFQKVRERYPRAEIKVLSSLAEGADQLCAFTALTFDFGLLVPLPMAQAKYEEDFEERALENFHRLLAKAEKVFVTPEKEPLPAGAVPRGYYYRQAGLYVAENSHILLALWDGKEILFPEGGGTYETIQLTMRGKGKIYHIQTPRSANYKPGTFTPYGEMLQY